MVTIEESITTVFWKIFNKLQQESSDKNTFEKSIEVFNNYRGRFKRMADNDIYSTMIQVVFFAGFKAKTVEESLPTILTYLGDFKKVAMYNEEDVQRILKDESMLKTKRKLKHAYTMHECSRALFASMGHLPTTLNHLGLT